MNSFGSSSNLVTLFWPLTTLFGLETEGNLAIYTIYELEFFYLRHKIPSFWIVLFTNENSGRLDYVKLEPFEVSKDIITHRPRFHEVMKIYFPD
jgi:hypothetical protein